jgi:hypothetical protein
VGDLDALASLAERGIQAVASCGNMPAIGCGEGIEVVSQPRLVMELQRRNVGGLP